MPVTIKDHAGLHEAVVRATLAGGAAAVAGIFLPAGPAAAVWALAVGCAVVPPASWTAGATVASWALVAGGGARVGGALGTAVAALALGALLGRGRTGTSRLVAGIGGVLGALAAALVARAFVLTGALDGLPSGIAALVTGAAGGLLLGVASLGRHLERPKRAVEDELRTLADDSELGRLLGRAAAAYRDAVEAIGGEAPAARAAADELAQKMTRFGRRWRELEGEAARSRPEDLKERLALVGRKLDGTNDPLARVELGRARDALSAQLAYLQEIAGGRERAVARLEHQVATLERLRLAALRHRSADASRLGAELQPVIEELAQAGGDFDIAAEALTEASGAAAPAAPVPATLPAGRN